MELQDAIRAANAVPDSIGRISLLEDAIRIADQCNEPAIAFDLRDDLISVCTEYGQFMKALMAFSWCLGRIDEDPERYPFDYNAIWNYQALLYRAAAFDQVSLERLNNLLEDFQRRMKDIGASERNIHESRNRVGLMLRNKEMVLTARNELKKHRRDSHCDCAACLQSTFVQAELYFGNYEKAMEFAQPLIDGMMSCNMVPLRTFGYMINYVYRSGDVELADKIYKKGIKLIGNKGGFLEHIGQYLIYLSDADHNEGVRVFKKALPWALNDTEMPWSLFNFHMGAYVLFNRLGKSRKMILNSKYAMYQESGRYDCTGLASYHYNTALAFAQRFDARNKNTVASDILAAERER